MGKDTRNGGQRVNMVEIFFTHVCKWKNETCWNCSRNGGREYRRVMEEVN
jgi:hypothetical protein